MVALVSRPFVTSRITFSALFAALFAIGCSERLTVYEAERLLSNAEIFDPILCATPLRLRGGVPAYWGNDNARGSEDAWRCIDAARTYELIRRDFVPKGDDARGAPNCLDGSFLVIEPVRGQSEVDRNGILMVTCGKSRVQVIDIVHDDHVARIFVREHRDMDPLTSIRLNACSLRDPDETWHDHVVDAYFARGEWHLGR